MVMIDRALLLHFSLQIKMINGEDNVILCGGVAMRPTEVFCRLDRLCLSRYTRKVCC